MLQYFSQERSSDQNLYSNEDFLFRWKKLERVLAKEGVDGLLLATGLDAKDSVHSAYLFNWLFLGLSGKSITINKYLDPIYSDVIVLISSKGNYIFITPQAKHDLENLIYCIPNCQVFCPTAKEYEDKELLDTLKIATFYNMTLKMNKLGVFLGQNDDAKLIQKWPLIQSYALEPVGRTFFTLKHQAVNLNGKLTPLFRNLDKHSLTNLVGRTAFSMQGHLKGSLMQIQLRESDQRKNVSQSLIQQSLQEAVDIQLFQSGSSEYKGLVRVLFGERTQTGDISSGQATIGSTNAQHLTVEHYDPYTKIKVWRTYFLNLSTKTKFQVKQKQIEEQDTFYSKNIYILEDKENPYYSNQNCLISLYSSLVQGVLESISAVSKDYRNLNNDFILKFIFGKISQNAKEIYGEQTFKITDLEAEIESFDSFGEPRSIDFKDSISFKLSSTFYVLKIRLKNIRSPSNKEKLGSIIFSESFLIQQGCYLLLTKKSPYFDFWNCAQSNHILSKLNPNYDFVQLGKPLSDEGYRNRIFIPCQKLENSHFNIPILDVKYYFHENGLRIYCDKIGWQLLFYKDLQDLTMVNRIPGQWVLMKTLRPFAFQGLQTNVLAIQFRGKPFQHLMNLSKQKKNPIQITYIQAIPPLLAQSWYFNTEVLRKQIKDGQIIYQHQILVPDFLWAFVESKQMMIMNQMKDIKMPAFRTIYQNKLEKKKQKINAPQNKHSILIIDGSYGAGKLKLAQNLKKYGPNEIKTHIFKISAENLFEKLSQETFMEMLQENIADNQINKDSVIITVVPSWLILTKLLPLLDQKYHIRSVLTKVNASNFFSSRNGNLVENVLTYCLPGYSQNIVVDAITEEESTINSVIKIIGSFNKEARIARSSSCLLTTGQCQDILCTTTYTGEQEIYLRAKYGALFNFEMIADLTLHYFEFKLPLYDISYIKKLTKSEGYLIDRKTVLKQLESKKKEAEQSKDDLMLGLYFLEQVMTIVRRRQKVTQIRSIKAFSQVRIPESKNDQKAYYEINWANQELQISEDETNNRDNRSLGFSILCRRFDEVEVKNFIQNLSYKKILFGQPKQMRTLDSLTSEEIQNIEKNAIKEQKFFDNGQSYDGYVLRNAEGYAIDNHPNLQKAMEGWISQWNQSVTKDNAELKRQWNKYVQNSKK